MKTITTYIVEKLYINKDTKVVTDDPKNVDELVDFINNWLDEKNIKSDDTRTLINASSTYFCIDIYLGEKFKDDYTYSYFTTLRNIIEKTSVGKQMDEAWYDQTSVRLHYKFKK